MRTKPPALLTIQPQDYLCPLRKFGRILSANTRLIEIFLLTNESWIRKCTLVTGWWRTAVGLKKRGAKNV
jgi:hypothetical protein